MHKDSKNSPNVFGTFNNNVGDKPNAEIPIEGSTKCFPVVVIVSYCSFTFYIWTSCF